MNTSERAILGTCVALLAATAAFAQQAPSVPYALTSGSENEIGCFDPCACPILIRGPMTGGFELTLTGVDGGFRRYDVTNVDWKVDAWDGDVSVSGGGEYRISEVVAPQQQMKLDLLVDGVPQHFDSGLVPMSASFPLIDVSVAVAGFFCWDSVFVVQAAPQGAGDVSPNRPAVQALAVPNPFQTVTRVAFDMPTAGAVDLRIHDVAGRLVRTLSTGRHFEAGPVSLAWNGLTDDGTEAPAGVYFARLVAPEVRTVLRVARVR